MCITNIYLDRYPDGKELEFRHTEICKYGTPGRPCAKHYSLENPIRNIQFGEATTEYMIVAQHRASLPQTPPRSAGGSHHRRQSSSVSSTEDKNNDGIRRRPSEHRPSRTRKERIIIVDSPPTPRTPPHPFSASLPNSPNIPFPRTTTPPFVVDGSRRPIIVDERPLQRDREIIRESGPRNSQRRDPSVGAVVGHRRSGSRERFGWDSPSSSHTSFDSRSRREVEEIERRKREREDMDRERDKALMDREIKDIERKERETKDRIKNLEAERRREERIRRQDEEIRRRPVVPVPPSPPRKGILKPAVLVPGGPSLGEGLGLGAGIGMAERRVSAGEMAMLEEMEGRRRLAERARIATEILESKEEEALKMRLRERQMPARRFSVGPGNRRHRVLYDDGVYRWE